MDAGPADKHVKQLCYQVSPYLALAACVIMSWILRPRQAIVFQIFLMCMAPNDSIMIEASDLRNVISDKGPLLLGLN